MKRIKAPEWLGEAGKKKWKEVVKATPTLTADDSDTLALLCMSWQTYLDASKEVAKGITIQCNGMTRVNPACAVASEALKQILKTSKLLGLSPDYSGGKKANGVSPMQHIVENEQ
jgi:P27 family predicted phage terminase small subunit